MQVVLNSTIYSTNIPKYHRISNNTPITKPSSNLSQPVAFMGASVVQKTVSSQIAHEKSKLLKHLNNILATNVPVISHEEKISILMRRANLLISSITKKQEKIEQELSILTENRNLNPQQKFETYQRLMKEFNRLSKTKLLEFEDKKPSKDNYDYALINKFKTAIVNDNFDLAKIKEEHYSELENIETVEEFKQKYPSIRIPANPRNVITQKIMDTLNRDFYLKINNLFEKKNKEAVTDYIFNFINKYFDRLSAQFEDKTKDDLIVLFGAQVAQKIVAEFEDLKMEDDFDLIPQNRMSQMAYMTAADKEMLKFDYDSLVIETLKQMYLEDKKTNQIEYEEDDDILKISSIKSPDYMFEKIPEKIKRIISDSKKIAKLQRDYQKFTTEELKSRLYYYNGTLIGNNEKIFDKIVAFDSCKFTEEDKQYLIKFLQILDDINDGKISIKEGVEIIQANNIRPLGTVKLDKIESLEREANIKKEQNKLIILNNLKKEFNDTINKLYEINLPDIAESFSKYYPETYDETNIALIKNVLERINKTLLLKNKNIIRAQLVRWEVYDNYLVNSSESESFIKAKEYSENFDSENKETRIGQYLLNREIVKNYPNSRDFFHRPKILDKIMEKFGQNVDLATTSLCKYEDYILLDKEKRQSIKNILELFNIQDSSDKILLKEIIEKDYINCDTTISAFNSPQAPVRTLASNVKKEILDKYKFPNCISLFEAFENALALNATEKGKAGIKKTGSNNNSLEHKMELKIIGSTDRLFSSKNNYYFDIYSEKGLH